MEEKSIIDALNTRNEREREKYQTFAGSQIIDGERDVIVEFVVHKTKRLKSRNNCIVDEIIQLFQLCRNDDERIVITQWCREVLH